MFLGFAAAGETTLSVLASRPGLSNAQLARRALVTPQSMIEILSKLEHRALVRRRAAPEHGRILRAELTPAGRALLRRADPVIAAIEQQVLDGIPASERQIVLRGMVGAMEQLS